MAAEEPAGSEASAARGAEPAAGTDPGRSAKGAGARTARSPTGPWRSLVAGLAAAMVIFYFYAAGVASVATQYHRGVYVFITYVLVFLLYPASGKPMRGGNPGPLDLLLAAISAGVVGYWIHQFEAINYRAGAETGLDALVSIAGIAVSLEVCRRVLGWAVTSIGLGAKFS